MTNIVSPSKRVRLEEGLASVPHPNGDTPIRARPQIIMVSSTTPAKRPRTNSTPSKPKKPRTSSSSGIHITPIVSVDRKGKGKAEDVGGLEHHGLSDDYPPTPSKTGRGKPRGSTSMFQSEDEEEEGEDADADASPRKLSGRDPSTALAVFDEDSAIRQTASDVYFRLSSHPSKTSDNIFTALLPHLTVEECTHLLGQSPANRKPLLLRLQKEALAGYEADFPQWKFELGQGFNLLFYGYGSKRELLNKFAMDVCRKIGNVVIINGYQSSRGLKELLESIEQIPGLATLTIPSPGGIEGQIRRIYEYFLPQIVETSQKTLIPASNTPPPNRSRRPLFLFIHNIDSPQFNFQNSRIRACLSLLTSNPRIHVIASLDNVHAPIMWSTQELLSRKHTEVPGTAFAPIPSSRGFAWIWHELATFAPYTVEITASRDISALPKSSSSSGASASVVSMAGMGSVTTLSGTDELLVGGGGRPLITELQISQVLASVTLKARRLFKVMGIDMLTRWAEALQNNASAHDGLHTLGMPYAQLMRRAKEEFLASNDLALKGLLQEFRDHGLVRSKLTAIAVEEQTEGPQTGEVYWIALPRDILERTVAAVNVD